MLLSVLSSTTENTGDGTPYYELEVSGAGRIYQHTHTHTHTLTHTHANANGTERACWGGSASVGMRLRQGGGARSQSVTKVDLHNNSTLRNCEDDLRREPAGASSRATLAHAVSVNTADRSRGAFEALRLKLNDSGVFPAAARP